jgi:hypothetical protein
MTESAIHLHTHPTMSMGSSVIAADGTSSGDRRMRPDTSPTATATFPVQYPDPLRSVQGTRARYDCPDLAALDGHLHHLRRRVAAVRTRSPDVAGPYRVDIDRLLDRRAWLTLPITDEPERPRAHRTSLTVG